MVRGKEYCPECQADRPCHCDDERDDRALSNHKVEWPLQFRGHPHTPRVFLTDVGSVKMLRAEPDSIQKLESAWIEPLPDHMNLAAHDVRLARLESAVAERQAGSKDLMYFDAVTGRSGLRKTATEPWPAPEKTQDPEVAELKKQLASMAAVLAELGTWLNEHNHATGTGPTSAPLAADCTCFGRIDFQHAAACVHVPMLPKAKTTPEEVKAAHSVDFWAWQESLSYARPDGHIHPAPEKTLPADTHLEQVHTNTSTQKELFPVEDPTTGLTPTDRAQLRDGLRDAMAKPMPPFVPGTPKRHAYYIDVGKVEPEDVPAMRERLNKKTECESCHVLFRISDTLICSIQSESKRVCVPCFVSKSDPSK